MVLSSKLRAIASLSIQTKSSTFTKPASHSVPLLEARFNQLNLRTSTLKKVFHLNLSETNTQQKDTTKHSLEICRRKVCKCSIGSLRQTSVLLYVKGRLGTCAACHIQMSHARKRMQLWNKPVLPSARGNCLPQYKITDLAICPQPEFCEGKKQNAIWSLEFEN